MSSAPWTDPTIPALSTFDLNDKLLGIDASSGISKTILGNVLLAGLSPSKLLHIRTEQDLIDKFGPNKIIPASESWTIYEDASLTHALPYKLGNDASLEIFRGSININSTYTGPGARFQLENLLNPARTLHIHPIDFTGDGANDVYDLKLSRIAILESVVYNNCNSVGDIETPFFDIQFGAMQGVKKGLTIIDPQKGNVVQFNLNQLATLPAVTLLTILAPTSTPEISAVRCSSSDSDSIMFDFDPGSPPESRYLVENTTGTFSELFKSGSLSSLDTQVIAKDNPGFLDSSIQAEVRTGVTLTFNTVSGTFVPLVNTVPVPGDFIQDLNTLGFTIDTSTGIVTYTGLNPIRLPIQFGFTAHKDGGGSDGVIFSLFKNNVQQTKTNNITTLTSTLQKIVYSGGLFSLVTGDQFQLKIDSNSASSINVFDLTVLFS